MEYRSKRPVKLDIGQFFKTYYVFLGYRGQLVGSIWGKNDVSLFAKGTHRSYCEGLRVFAMQKISFVIPHQLININLD